MKKLKVFLSSLAFVCAIVMVFAFSETNLIATPHGVNDLGQCVPGTLVDDANQDPADCSITNTKTICRIEVTGVTTTVTNAYDGQNCDTESLLLKLPY